MKALAVKYRPTTFDELTEQESIKVILREQLATNTIQHSYLFCGGAGTGKTTSARIFANEINKGLGNPIEMDAASHNGVDDVRGIIQQAKTQSIDSEYKIFIIDECHSLSNSAWQAMLKLIEEPPAKSIFIFCTTDPQKIPKTILSRVQRYDFQRISHNGIVNRLNHIISSEGITKIVSSQEALEYIAKIADGGMRDAITLLDKCLSYSKDLTLDNVLATLGTVDYVTMKELYVSLSTSNMSEALSIVNDIYNAGKDLKQFFTDFRIYALDVIKNCLGVPSKYIITPITALSEEPCIDTPYKILDFVLKLCGDVKFDSNPKSLIEANIICYLSKENVDG